MRKPTSQIATWARIGCRGLLAMSLCASGCKTLFDYPSTEHENTSARCADGMDNDFDGIIDCDDPDCDGHCSEQGSTRCQDGRDNDGDGLIDAWDPRCWPLRGPEVLRCASRQPMDFEERFDGPLLSTRWSVVGAEAVVEPPRAREERPDSVLSFPSNQLDAETVLSSTVVDGDWSAFELGVQLRIEQQGFLRVGLVPSVFAPDGAAPVEGAELMSVAIEIDARATPTLVLVANGARRNADAVNVGEWHALTLRSEGEELRLSIDTEVVAKTKRPTMGASRLVIWGASEREDGEPSAVQLDDLHLRLAGKRPCHTASPQIPFGSSCPLDDAVLTENLGHTVSIDHDATQGYCAVLTAGDIGQDTANRARAWMSATGATWAATGTVPTGSDEGLIVGVGVARDPVAKLWRAAIVHRYETATTLRVAASPDCADWGSARQVAELPTNAGAPSYLIPGVTAPQEVYFTRPAESGGGATLWRALSSDGEAFVLDDAAVTTFPGDAAIHAPVALTRAGAHDIVLTHLISPSTGVLGLGLWVAADDALTRWERASGWPLIESDPAGGGFDDESILSGAVVWGHDQAFLLYGADGQPVSPLHRTGETASFSVGTAALFPSGGTSEANTSGMLGSCGDGQCADDEACAGCPVDCGVCDGAMLLAETFSSGADWSYVGPDESATTSLYVSKQSERANVAAGQPGWLSRELDSPLLGDFELSFDLHWVAPEPDENEPCTAFVGLSRASSAPAMDPEGIYVQLDRQLPCTGRAPAFSPRVRVAGKRLTSLTIEAAATETGALCSGTVQGIPEAWHRVTLTRRTGRVSVSVSGRDGCGSLGTSSVAYPGTIDGFSRLLVGWGGESTPEGWTPRCTNASAGFSVDNVVLRTLPCPANGQACTDPDTGQSVCVDLTGSPEHCGACFTSIAPAEICLNGEAACAATSCPAPGSAIATCADLAIDRNHCGSCGHAVGDLETCADGTPRAAMVELPEGFSIDATEVTRAQYEAWLLTEPSASKQAAYCSWNTDFKPGCFWPPGDHGDLPVVCVDWCDAMAYCVAVGKRLCGQVGGAAAPYGEANTKEGQWFTACTSGGANLFPYGSSYEPKSCNGADNKLGGAPYTCAVMLPVASLPTCQSPLSDYGGVYDLSGNVIEWLDACNQDAGDTDRCRVAGGSTCNTANGAECGVLIDTTRNTSLTQIGFRCCS